MDNKQSRGTPFSASTTHATSAVANVAAITGSTHYITDITGSSDLAGALILVKQGTTIVWQSQLSTTAVGSNALSHSFRVPIAASPDALVSVTVNGTAACYANIAGYTL